MKKTFILASSILFILSLFSCASSQSDEAASYPKAPQGPEYTAERIIVPSDKSAQDLVNAMGIGWNLGNSLDVCNADRDGDGRVNEHAAVVDETLWGNPITTKKLFETLKKDGISSVRIPVTWRDHLKSGNIIEENWMNRVQQVVDYALDSGLYVIINIHHDGGGDPQFGAWVRSYALENYNKFYDRYSTIWNQICKRFKDYDEHLVFESLNEVGFDELSPARAHYLLLRINQDFVNLVRNSGGNNKKRYLLIAGYWTDFTAVCGKYYRLPSDSENRIILSVHYYTPWQFCVTNAQHTWGTENEVAQMERLFKMMYDNYVAKGIPVIIGEYGHDSRNDEKSCAFFVQNVCRLSRQYNMAPFYWDDGAQFNRKTYEWRRPSILNAMFE